MRTWRLPNNKQNILDLNNHCLGLEIDYLTDYVVNPEKRKTPEPLIYKASDVLIAGDERIELCIFIPLKWGKALIYKAFRLLET